MKELIKGVFDWHEDATGVIGNEKFEHAINDIYDLYLMHVHEIYMKMRNIYPEFYCAIILDEYYKLKEENETKNN